MRWGIIIHAMMHHSAIVSISHGCTLLATGPLVAYHLMTNTGMRAIQLERKKEYCTSQANGN